MQRAELVGLMQTQDHCRRAIGDYEDIRARARFRYGGKGMVIVAKEAKSPG